MYFIGISTAVLRLDIPLNFDSRSMYSLIFRAFDMGTLRRYSENGSIEISIDDLADHSPVFIQQNYSVTISEDTPQITSVLRVSISLPEQ